MITRRRKPRLTVESGARSFPTPELVAHHDIADRAVPDRIGARAWKVATRVEALFAAERIDNAEYTACERYYQDWAFGLEASSPERGERVDGSGAGGVIDARLDALGRYAAASREIGRPRALLLLWSVCQDCSWREIGRRIGLDDKAAERGTVNAIQALAVYYGLMDGRRAA